MKKISLLLITCLICSTLCGCNESLGAYTDAESSLEKMMDSIEDKVNTLE